MIDLDKFERLVNLTTPGPWSTDKPSSDSEGWALGVKICTVMGNKGVYATPPRGQAPWADAQFIAAARSACVELIAEVRRLRSLAPASECAFCGRPADSPCMSTRDTADRDDKICFAALMLAGGGERSADQAASMALFAAMKKREERP